MMRASVFFVAVALVQSTLAGTNNVGVIGGVTITIEEAPYMALLYTGEREPCGGTIIDEQFLLTVDHCCDDGPYARTEWMVQAGSDGRITADILRRKISNVFKFEKPGTDYRLKPNLCIVKVDSPLIFSDKVDKIKLEEPYVILANGTWVHFTAFGHSGLDDKSARQLRRGIVPIVDVDWCKEESKHLPGGQICAGDSEHNACFGDSAGALTYGNYLIGVLSETDCSGSNASRFSKISGFRPWILKTITENK